MNGNEFELPFERILTVALNTGCSGYDAQFIALAEDLGTQLFTFDQKILKNAKHIARNPPDF
ncbi:MAG: type II toxin-antitoxin system VapC family toxin [Verrucomicrobia bacterium]|nr:type II toxin-antitoxin system VapC family toxin [Verrucomicrobiota bacterium]